MMWPLVVTTLYYFDTLFPRIPVPAMRQVVGNLEKMKLPTNPSGLTGETHRHGSDDTARRPPSVKASLSVSFGQRAPHRASTRDSSSVPRTVPSSERPSSEDLRSHRSQRHEFSEREHIDRDKEGDLGQDRERDGDRNYVRGREKDIGRERDRNRERYRSNDRGRQREQSYDRRSKYVEREGQKEYDRERSWCYHSRSRSHSHSRSDSLQVVPSQQSSPPRDGNKERKSAFSNLAILRDLYGDSSNQKGDPSNERIPRMSNGGEEVIRLGGSTWK